MDIYKLMIAFRILVNASKISCRSARKMSVVVVM